MQSLHLYVKNKLIKKKKKKKEKYFTVFKKFPLLNDCYIQ